MFKARTACAIALLLAPTGVAAAGMSATVPAQHTAYVEITITDEPDRGLAALEAYVVCDREHPVEEAMAWLGADGCSPPPGAAIYVSNAQAPSPTDAGPLVPTGTVYAYEDADRVWTVREYTYSGLSGTEHHAYVMAPDIADRVDDRGSAEPVRGVVDLDKLGIGPGEDGQLSTTLAAGPQTSPDDPTVQHVDADRTPMLRQASGLTG